MHIRYFHFVFNEVLVIPLSRILFLKYVTLSSVNIELQPNALYSL